MDGGQIVVQFLTAVLQAGDGGVQFREPILVARRGRGRWGNHCRMGLAAAERAGIRVVHRGRGRHTRGQLRGHLLALPREAEDRLPQLGLAAPQLAEFRRRVGPVGVDLAAAQFVAQAVHVVPQGLARGSQQLTQPSTLAPLRVSRGGGIADSLL